MDTDWGVSAEEGQVYLVDLKELFIKEMISSSAIYFEMITPHLSFMLQLCL